LGFSVNAGGHVGFGMPVAIALAGRRRSSIIFKFGLASAHGGGSPHDQRGGQFLPLLAVPFFYSGGKPDEHCRNYPNVFSNFALAAWSLDERGPWSW